jgi:hypothetical protein
MTTKTNKPQAEKPEGEVTMPPVKTSFAQALEIERGVPIPRGKGVRAHAYPFDKMQVNDSIFIERGEKTVNISNIKSLAEKRVPGTKWTTRKVTEEHDGVTRTGFRLWRVA